MGDFIMVNVRIDEDELLSMLMDRVDFWTGDADIKKLYEVYYSDLIDSGCFEGVELNISLIVDNDYINNLSVYDDIEDIMKDFRVDEEEVRDRIVAEYNGSYLVRTY